MTHGFDTGFLVAFEVVGHIDHVASRSRLLNLGSAGDDFAIAPQVLAEFIHIVTDANRFVRPLVMDKALERAGAWWKSPEVRQIVPNAAAIEEFLAWMKMYRLGRKRILDTLLAATYKTAGIASVLTTNARDFAVFSHFQVVQP